MAKQSGPTPADIELAVKMLAEIVTSADAADRRALFMAAGADGEKLELHADNLRSTIRLLGWIAERALCKLGANDVLARGGKAENWLMSPACREIEEASHG